jgi:hypothetical protein
MLTLAGPLVLRFADLSQPNSGTTVARLFFMQLTEGKREDAMPPFNPRTAPLDDVAKWVGDSQIGSSNHAAGMAELTRRQIVGQIEATDAEKRAAAASERNANYMLWSVIAAAISAVAALISQP